METSSSPGLQIGVGPTADLNLRVSVAVLVRLLFEHPRDRRPWLALEWRTKVDSGGERIAQPFGGALRIHDVAVLRDIVGNFHFDSTSSRRGQDFRIFVHPSAWQAVQQFCVEHFLGTRDEVLETDPSRELAEEIAETLGIHLHPDQYVHRPSGIVIQEKPTPTWNIHARGHPTVRVYRIFEASVLDPGLAGALTSAGVSRSSGAGNPDRAPEVLTVPVDALVRAYRGLEPVSLNEPVQFEGDVLDATVAAILDGVIVAGYRRL